MTSGPSGGPELPDRVLRLSKDALELHDPSLPVAALLADTLLDPSVPLPGGASRRLLFERDGICVDVTLHSKESPTGSTLTELRIAVLREPSEAPEEGELEPAGYTLAELLQASTRTQIKLTDGAGTLATVPEGLTSLVLAGEVGLPALRTAWFTI